MSASHVARSLAIYTTAQVRSVDRRAIDELGIEGFELMQRAARAAWAVVLSRWPEVRSLGIYCGAGNNAGDGYVLATLAAAAGLTVELIAVSDPQALEGDAGRAFALAREAGLVPHAFAPGGAGPTGPVDLVVDAVLGTGLTRDVDGAMAEAVAEINAAAAPVLALDVPTGLDSDTGAIRGVAVGAEVTVTFVGLKSGLYLGRGPAMTGEIEFADLDLPAAAFAGTWPVLTRIDPDVLPRILKRRSRMSHKGMNGNVLIVGGSSGMPGAARLAAEAALRAGAGLVHAAVAADSVGPVMAGRPEIMCRAVAAPRDFADWIDAADVIVLGPGLGRQAWGEALAAAVLGSDRPLVVDADGLNYLARHPARRDDWVLTPHPGEAGRLLACATSEVQAHRARAADRIAENFGGFAVLKGACTLVAQSILAEALQAEAVQARSVQARPAASERVPISVCDAGNPGMATGGMGDVLAGVVGGLIAQFGCSRAVVECAVLAHARAADAAAAAGERGLLASDLFACLRRELNPS